MNPYYWDHQPILDADMERRRQQVDREHQPAAFQPEAVDREHRVVRPPGHLLEARSEAAVAGPAAAAPEQTQSTQLYLNKDLGMFS